MTILSWPWFVSALATLHLGDLRLQPSSIKSTPFCLHSPNNLPTKSRCFNGLRHASRRSLLQTSQSSQKLTQNNLKLSLWGQRWRDCQFKVPHNRYTANIPASLTYKTRYTSREAEVVKQTIPTYTAHIMFMCTWGSNGKVHGSGQWHGNYFPRGAIWTVLLMCPHLLATNHPRKK